MDPPELSASTLADGDSRNDRNDSTISLDASRAALTRLRLALQLAGSRSGSINPQTVLVADGSLVAMAHVTAHPFELKDHGDGPDAFMPGSRSSALAASFRVGPRQDWLDRKLIERLKRPAWRISMKTRAALG